MLSNSLALAELPRLSHLAQALASPSFLATSSSSSSSSAPTPSSTVAVINSILRPTAGSPTPSSPTSPTSPPSSSPASKSPLSSLIHHSATHVVGGHPVTTARLLIVKVCFQSSIESVCSVNHFFFFLLSLYHLFSLPNANSF